MKNGFKFAAMAMSLSLGLCQGAHATSSWGVTFTGSNTTDSLGDTVATTSYSSNGVNLSISGAYGTDGTTSGSYSSGFASGTKWTTGTTNSTVTYFSGYGLAMDSNGDTVPNHALGNNGNTEAVLLSFSQAVTLSQLNLGYVCTTNQNGYTCDSHGANVSILAYTGTGTPANLNTVTASGTLSSGWSLVGNYTGLQTGATTVDASNISSSWFLISAYNTAFGSTSANGNSSWLSEGTDFFKIYSVAGSTATTTTKKAPEPGSLALAGIALLGAVWTRRRNARQAC